MRRYTIKRNISRLMAALLCMVLLITSFPTAFAEGESGSLGSNLQWSLSDGTLTITGSGDMADIPEMERAPWHELRDEIYRVILPEGLTSIGNLAFYECERLQSVVIPDSVTRIGNFAFAYCKKLEMLNLGGGVISIGEAAFTDCHRLTSLQLPGTLRSIGKKAFYRCETITTVTVPASVTSMGVATFGYCKSLVSANIMANISELPTLLFYGCEMLSSVVLPDSVESMGYHTFQDCDRLQTVYYNGENQEPEMIQQTIGRDVPDFRDEGTVTEGSGQESVSAGAVKEDESGNTVYESTSVSQKEDSTISSQIYHTESQENSQGSTSNNITVTITGDSGWKEAIDGVNEAIQSAEELADSSGNDFTQTDVTIYVQGTDSIDQNFIDNFAGRDITVTVITQDGSRWKFNGSELDSQIQSTGYDLRYEVTPGSAELCEELGTTKCYVVRFLAPAQINAEVMILLNPSLSLQNATLFERREELTTIQSSVIDMDGYAHFYLASVAEDSEYYIALNMKEAEGTAIVPEVVQTAYGKPEYVEPIKYEITGRKSSWGMTFNQVTWIMAGVLGGCVVIVGIVMFVLNKRKLRMGYVPEWDDEEIE